MALADGTHFLASDVHWQPAAPGAPAPTGAFGRFLAALAERAPCRLYVLGDLFDFWLERDGRVFDFYAAHIDALTAATAAGVETHLLFGNRDFTYGDALPRRAGVQIAGDRLALEVGGRRLLLHHGDLWCSADRRYQLYRRVIRSPLTAALARLVPWSRWPGIIARMRAASAAEVSRKPAAVQQIVDRTVAAEAAAGFDLLVCGHVHQPARRPIPGTRAELVTLGPWDELGGWYVAAGAGGVALHRFPG